MKIKQLKRQQLFKKRSRGCPDQLRITSYLNLWDINYSISSLVSMYVTKNMDTPITVELISYNLGMNINHINQYFKEEYKISTSDYIRKIKFNHSIWLLSSTQKPISEIAQCIGYNDQSAFSHSFKKNLE